MHTTQTHTIQLTNPIYRRRQRINKIMLMVAAGAVFFGLFWLFWIIFTLLYKGAAAVSWSLFTETTPPPGAAGGLLNAILVSLMMSGGGTLLGTTIGSLAGTYLFDYGNSRCLAPTTRC